jgi:2-octaprenylphenol hydroxylase
LTTRGTATIVVAGAGVVGLAAAALLVHGRCADRLRVHVLDARAPPRWTPERMDVRVYALSRASQQIFEQLGSWRRVTELRAAPYRRMHVWEGDDAFASTALTFDSAEIGEPDLGHIVEDSLLRTVLVDALTAAPNAQLGVGAQIGAVEVDEHSVVATLDNGGTVRGSALLAADGSDSAARRLLDLPVASHSYEQTAIVTHVTTTQTHRDTAWQRFLPGGPLALLPLSDGRSSVVWSLPTPAAERLLAASDTELSSALSAASARVLGDVTASAPRAGFALQALHALRYTAPRVALLGDAAHTVHPLAGQGMNLGLLDAACIARVIEEALLAGEDVGDHRVLRRYERERKGANVAMLVAFDGLNRLFRLPAWARPLRGLGLRAVDAAPALRRLLMTQALGLASAEKQRSRWQRPDRQA